MSKTFLLIVCILDVTQVLITGYLSQNSLMEVINANGTTSICNASSHKYPNDLSDASGGFIDNKMIICGGTYLWDAPLNISCYSFGRQNEWQLHSSQKDPDNVAYGSAAIPLFNGLWITGGVTWTNDFLDSTEIVLSNGTRVDGGIRLPSPVYYQCGVKHNGIAILIGGI